MLRFLKNPEYNAVKILLVFVVILLLGIFIIYQSVFRRGLNQAQVIDLGGPLNSEAVLPSLLSTGFDTGAGNLFDTSNADIRKIFDDTGINMLRIHPGVTSNYAHHNGPGMGLTQSENDFWNGDGTKDTELSYSTTFDGNHGNPFTRFYDKYIDLAQNIRRPVVTYSLNVVTQTAVGLTAPVPIDAASINLAIAENLAAIQGLIDQGVVVEGVQLCSECGPNAPSTTTNVSAFSSVDHFIARVHPIALAIQNAYPDIRIQLHVVVPNPNHSDYGVDSNWNEGIRSGFADIDKLDIGTYLWTDGFVNTDEVCDPANNTNVQGFNMFECYRDRTREMLDVHIPAALDAYTSFFGPTRGFRATQVNINNYDQSTINPQFSTAAFENTFVNAATIGELLFKIADFNDSHDNIVKSASLMSFSGSLKNLVSKTKPNTTDSTLPSDQLYNSYYTQNALKLNAAGLTYKLIKPVFDGFHEVLDVSATFPESVPNGEAQLYGFTDLNTDKTLYFIYNWSDEPIALSSVSLDGTAIEDPNADITITEIYGQKLSSTYGRADERNTDGFTPLIDADPVSYNGTDEIVIKPFSIARIEGLEANTAARVDDIPPTAPTNLDIASQTPSSVTLTWDASTDDSGEVEDYVVYKVTEDEVASSCDPNNGDLRYCNEIYNQSDIVVATNIEFSPTYDLKFDMYSPPSSDTATNRPVYIHNHGGGGESEGSASTCNQYARLGYVCIAGDYRGGSGQGFTIAEQAYSASDVHALIRFLRIHANEYGIDPNKIMLGGVSAGGVTSLLAAVSGNDTANTSWFKSATKNIDNATYGNGSPVPSWSCMATSNSGPLTPPSYELVDANDPPIVSFLGGLDTNHGWTCSDGEDALDLMQGFGIPSFFQCFPNSDHSLGEDEAIDAIVIPRAYTELVVESCPQSYSNISRI